MRYPSAVLALAVATLMATVACGGSTSGPNNTTASTITIAPTLLTLQVGGAGSLTATVRDAAGAVIPNPTVTWTSRLALVASVDNQGNVSGLSVGTTTVVASAGGVKDSVLVVVTDPIMLEVQPAAATVSVGNTQPFTVIARNSAGQIVAHGPVTWASANISIATINANGVATGRATGTTFITAAASGVTSAPATLNVTNACADPNGWLRATSFDAVLEYDWVDSGLTDGGFRIDAEYHAKVTARLTLLSATPFQIAFAGDVTGTASFKESKRDPTTPNTTATLQGEGAMVPILGLPPTMILIIDPIACTFTRDAGVSLNTLLTEPDGRTTRADALVASVHQAPLPLTATAATGLGSFDARSQPWAALNRDKNSFVPRGFAHELTSSRDHLPGPAPTQASVLWLMTAR